MKTELDTLFESIRAFRRHREWSINRLAKETRVPWSVLRDMDKESWSPSAKTIRALLEFMRTGAPAPERCEPRPAKLSINSHHGAAA